MMILTLQRRLQYCLKQLQKQTKPKNENDKDNAIKYISILIKLARVLGFDLEKVELDENQLKEKLAEIIDEFDFTKTKI